MGKNDYHNETLGKYAAAAPKWEDMGNGPKFPAESSFVKDRIGTSAERKKFPLCTGVLDYFPDALLAVAEVSRIGNDQHNPGEPLHWAKDKSIGVGDEIARHLIDRGKRDLDGGRHSAKLCWRALELCQREIEAERETGTR